MSDETPPAWAKDLMTQMQELRVDMKQTATIAQIDALRGDLMHRMDRLQEAVEARYEDAVTQTNMVDRIETRVKNLRDETDAALGGMAALHRSVLRLESRIRDLEGKVG